MGLRFYSLRFVEADLCMPVRWFTAKVRHLTAHQSNPTLSSLSSRSSPAPALPLSQYGRAMVIAAQRGRRFAWRAGRRGARGDMSSSDGAKARPSGGRPRRVGGDVPCGDQAVTRPRSRGTVRQRGTRLWHSVASATGACQLKCSEWRVCVCVCVCVCSACVESNARECEATAYCAAARPAAQATI